MGRVQTAGEARCLLPAFLCADIFIKRKTSGYEAGRGRVCESVRKWFSIRFLLGVCFGFFFGMKTQANYLTSVILETILASKLFKNCWAVGLTCDKSTSLQSLFMAISRSCHVHVRLWYSSVGITRLKLCTSMMFRSFSPCQDRKTIFSFNYCKMTQNTGDEWWVCLLWLLSCKVLASIIDPDQKATKSNK